MPRLQRYETQRRTLAGRKSYSKTDPDAVFIRGKDQKMYSRELRAGYNVQLGTQNRFVLGYSIHQKPSDMANIGEHLDTLNFVPKKLVGDAGYGSLAKYEDLQKRVYKLM